MDTNSGEYKVVNVNEINPGPIRLDRLPEMLYNRAKVIYEITFEVQHTTFAEFETNFRRDINPESEINIWERIATAYHTFVKDKGLSIEKKREVYSFVVTASLGMIKPDTIYKDTELLTIDEQITLTKYFFAEI